MKLLVLLLMCSYVCAQFREYLRHHAKNDILNDIEADSDHYYAVYTAPKGTLLEERLLGIVGAFVYALVSERFFFIDPDVDPENLFPSLKQFELPFAIDGMREKVTAEKAVYGPQPQSKYGLVRRDEIGLFGCTSKEQDRRVQFHVLDNTEYIVPLLMLNGGYSGRLSELFPGGMIFKTVLENLLKSNVYAARESTEKVSVVLDGNEYDQSTDDKVMRCLKELSSRNLFILSNLQQHYRFFAQRSNFHLTALPSYTKSKSDRSRLQDILTAANATSNIIIQGDSALGEVIGAIAHRPPIILNHSQCSTCRPCRPLKDSDPCYGRTLRAYVQACVGNFSGDREYGQIFSRPESIDACKSRAMGIQLVQQ